MKWSLAFYNRSKNELTTVRPKAMKSTGLIIAAVVLAALSGVLYWSNRHPPSENTAKASIDTPPKILSLKQEDISKIQAKKQAREKLDLPQGPPANPQTTPPTP